MMAPLSSRNLMAEALEGELERTKIYVGRPESRQASVTNRPINPLEPITMIRPVSDKLGEEPFIFVDFIMFGLL